MLRPEVASVSQQDRLRAVMARDAITHGQTVRADIEHVEVSRKFHGKELVFFCGIQGLRVRETVRPGDGHPLPDEVAVTGLAVEREGLYNVRNALISSNGRIEVTLDDRSRVVPVNRLTTWATWLTG
ncbi:MAG TPA: hypothetical protein VGQ17_00490 [Gemmatimonadales bacterium]|nr:hypothetical protein [Gemmatimonadales bacterium]